MPFPVFIRDMVEAIFMPPLDFHRCNSHYAMQFASYFSTIILVAERVPVDCFVFAVLFVSIFNAPGIQVQEYSLANPFFLPRRKQDGRIHCCLVVCLAAGRLV